MGSIEFDAIFGDEIKRVVVSQHEGTGNDAWHINVAGYNHGMIMKRGDEYWYVNDKLNSDDIQAIVDRIIAYTGEPWQRANIHVPNHPKFPIKPKYI